MINLAQNNNKVSHVNSLRYMTDGIAFADKAITLNKYGVCEILHPLQIQHYGKYCHR